MQTHKVIHFRNKCIGCNSCVCLAAQNWQMEEKDGQSLLIGAKEKKAGVFVLEILDVDLEDNKKAAEACPVNIIQVEENLLD